MVLSNQLSSGMTISIGDKIYRVESVVKVTVPKGTPFIKAKLRELHTQELIEKNFKPNQELTDVALQERKLEFLYPEGKEFLFLDIESLDPVTIPIKAIGEKINYLKEGIGVSASFYGDAVFTIEFPQFLELMVAKTDEAKRKAGEDPARIATLETGAKIEVPTFIQAGDIIKFDTRTNEYIQRV